VGRLTSTAAELRLALNEYEENDLAKGDYLAFDATVAAHGFAGQTRFWVGRGHLDEFSEELSTLDTSLRGRAELVCGWGEDVYFSLVLEPSGSSGRLFAQVEVANLAPSGGGMDRVQTAFVILPNVLTEFRRALSDVVASRAYGVAMLVEDREAGV
jgi:hypothetical protein